LSLNKPDQFLQKVTISLGVASFPEHGLSTLEITQSADAALYLAKAKGRNCVITASELLL
jgi:diguanylate cyclase (GGDEF)-like protein